MTVLECVSIFTSGIGVGLSIAAITLAIAMRRF
jgi:hypothetical protein